MTTTHPSPESYAAFNIAGRLGLRVPIATRTRVTRVIGQSSVSGVEVEDLATGDRRVVECHTIVFTGDWVPDHELARSGGLNIDPGTGGPRVETGVGPSSPMAPLTGWLTDGQGLP